MEIKIDLEIGQEVWYSSDGTTVYLNGERFVESFIAKRIIKEVWINDRGIGFVADEKISTIPDDRIKRHFWIDDLGITIFKTKEDALKKRRMINDAIRQWF